MVMWPTFIVEEAEVGYDAPLLPPNAQSTGIFLLQPAVLGDNSALTPLNFRRLVLRYGALLEVGFLARGGADWRLGVVGRRRDVIPIVGRIPEKSSLIINLKQICWK